MTPAVARRVVSLAKVVILVAAAVASVLALCVCAGTLWMMAARSPTIFDVVAETERVVMTYRGDDRLPWRWNVEDATVRRGAAETAFSGSVQLGFPVEVTMERVGLGSLWISIRHETAADGSCRNATLFGMNEEVWDAVPCEFELLLNDIPARAARGQTTLLTLEGDISAGRPIGFESQGTGTSILRSAQITLREKTWLSSRRYDAETHTLGAGDFFQVSQIDQEARATGVAVVDERPAITAAFRVVGKSATVVRPGGGESVVASDIYARVRNDRVLQSLVVLTGILVGLIGLSASVVGGMNDSTKEPTEETSSTLPN